MGAFKSLLSLRLTSTSDGLREETLLSRQLSGRQMTC